MPATLVRTSPVTLSHVDECLVALSEALPRLAGLKRASVLVEIDRLLDIRLTLTRMPVEAGE